MTPARLVAPLLTWLRNARRDLPWRRRRDPYAVWVSEIMLQQTQVATVIPYFERWMQRFPTVEALAAAPLDDVLKAWEGLGYYARGRNLQRAAQIIVARHGGALPADAADLLALPGIGRYTAGAILSLAFGQAAPILDGNVRRVLCRIYDIGENPRAPATEKVLWETSSAWVKAAPAGAAGDLNEALMELGALVCTPAAPQCPVCPVADACLARKRGTVAERPLRVAKRASPHFDIIAAILQDEAGRYLLVQRPVKGLLGGLWGFPGGAAAPGEALEAAVVRTVREQVGVTVMPQARLATVKHAYTHFKITLHPFHCRSLAGSAAALTCAAVRWTPPEAVADYALPVTDRKVWCAAQAEKS